MGFTPSRADQDLWIRKSEEYTGYDYIATHVDDLIIASKDPLIYISQIEQEFALRNIEDSPKFYLGSDVSKKGKLFHISNKTYIEEMLRSYQDQHGTIKKENIPITVKMHPELDKSDYFRCK